MLTHPLDVTLASRRRWFAAALLGIGVAGCSLLRGQPTVLGGSQDGVVFATTNCEVPNADGQRCDKKTCKTDQKSNCEYFAERCLATGHNYSGTQDAGTCTRVLDN